MKVRIAPEAIPRLPVFGWMDHRAAGGAPTPCLLDSENIHFTTSGRAAIAHALKALSVGKGDRVLVPTYHCPTMVAPVVHLGAHPVFYPVRSGCVDIGFLENVDLTRVRALIAAHYFGLPQPMAELRSFCDRTGIALIEDCAHALFGVSDGRPVGSWGDYAIASFTKFFPVPEGGALIANRLSMDFPTLARRSLADEIKSAADILEFGARYGRLRGLNWALHLALAAKRKVRPGPDPATEVVEADLVEVDDPVDEFDSERAFARVTLACRWVVRGVDRARIVDRRRKHFGVLADEFVGVAGVSCPWPCLPESAVPYVFPLRVEEADATYYALKAAGVPVFRWDRPWPGTPFFPRDEGCTWSRQILQIPCHQDLTQENLTWLIARIHEVLATVADPGKRSA